MSEENISLIKLAERTMVQSMLVFLLADLRILSAAGKINTKYERLCIDSDRVRKQGAQDFALHTTPDYESCGVSAAHIMAVLLLEITRESDQLAVERGSTGKSPLESLILDKQTIESATTIPSLLQCYREMIKSDMVGDAQKIRKADLQFPSSPPERTHLLEGMASELSVLSPEFDPDVDTNEDPEASRFTAGMVRGKHRAKVAMKKIVEETKTLKEIDKLQSALFVPEATKDLEESEFYSRQEVLRLLNTAIDGRDEEHVRFIETFFKDGSISQNLIQSKAETVWINDWNQKYECTYAISIDKEKKNVLLAFRGAYTMSDWSHVIDTKVRATSNPIKENYPGRPDKIKLHGGIHRYLFRVRKDTKTTKFAEIASKVMYYCDLVGEGVTLTVTGHSLGAALTVIFSFYASTNDKFTQNGAIEAVTFGGPMVGGYKFADAVRYQENQKKLRIARFYCVRDGVPHLPLALFWMSKRGAKHFHNGIKIKLPMIRKGVFKCIGQPQPVISYDDPPKSKLRGWLKQVRGYYFWNIPIRFWLIGKMHTLVEHKKRLLLINQMKDSSLSPLVSFSLKELYEMKDDLKKGIASKIRAKSQAETV